jgi:tol-pal system protein YbgF
MRTGPIDLRYVAQAVAVALALAAGMGSAHAQGGREMGALLDRIDRLERELGTLQRQVYQGRPPPPSAASPAGSAGISADARYRADLEVRLSQIEQELRTGTGRNEELAHAVREVRERMEKLVADVDARLATLERAQGITPGAAMAPPPPMPDAPPPGVAAVPPPPTPGSSLGAPPRPLGTLPSGAVPAGPPPPARAATLPQGSPKEQYDYAFSLVQRQDYKSAEAALKSFIAGHPKDDLADDAQYWLGRVYFARQDFQPAAFAFAEGIEKFPSSPRTADALLHLGLSLARLGKTDQACTALSRLQDNFPGATETVKKRSAAERQRIKCKA